MPRVFRQTSLVPSQESKREVSHCASNYLPASRGCFDSQISKRQYSGLRSPIGGWQITERRDCESHRPNTGQTVFLSRFRKKRYRPCLTFTKIREAALFATTSRSTRNDTGARSRRRELTNRQNKSPSLFGIAPSIGSSTRVGTNWRKRRSRTSTANDFFRTRGYIKEVMRTTCGSVTSCANSSDACRSKRLRGSTSSNSSWREAGNEQGPGENVATQLSIVNSR